MIVLDVHPWRVRSVAHFDVAGTPEPQGSKSIARAGERAWLIEGKSASGRRKLTAWRADVAAEARRWAEPGRTIQRGVPVSLTLTFRLVRPASLPKRRYSFATKRPDVDKLVRATCDALTGLVYVDDSQVVHSTVVKRYADPGEPTGCSILVGVVEHGGEP